MTQIGQIERHTQNRIVRLFTEELQYDYLGNREERQNNSNIEEELLTQYLTRKEYSIKKDDWRGNLQKENEIKAALYEVLQEEKEVERIFAIVKEQREY